MKFLPLLGLVVLFASACGTSESVSEAPTRNRETVAGAQVTPVDPGEGHRKMVELLQRIAAESLETNPYLGKGQSTEIRRKLAALPQDVPDLRLWLFHKLLGRHELRLGNNEQAIGHYSQAYAQLEFFRSEIPPKEAMSSVFELGVAYMRLGESQNCAERHASESCILPIQGGGIHELLDGSQNAVRYFTEVLEQTPRGAMLHVKATWLLNIAYMTLGRYPDGVPEAYRIDPRAFAPEGELRRFVDIAPKLGLDSFDLAGGAVVDDFDGDGDLDVLVSTSDCAGPMHYHRNEGDGTFSDRTAEVGLTGLLGGLNMIQADYDNDGRTDVFVLRGAWWREEGRHPNSLLRNHPDGTFHDVTFEAGLGEVHYPTQTADWADYDNDGDLDLYVGNESGAKLAAPSQLFRNNGNGTFSDVAALAGVTNDRYAKAVSWGDYDGDRFPDLYVSNLAHDNRLYHNNGDGTFIDVAQTAGVTRPVAGFPAWFWDHDNDGALDIFAAAYGAGRAPLDVAHVAAGYMGLPTPAELPKLYRGDGKGGFSEIGAKSGLGRVTQPMGSNFGDLDNDGFPDFYLGTGYPYYEALMPNVMYRNDDGQRFVDVTISGGFGHLQKGHAVVFADLDGDGDQDLFEQIGGAYPGDAYGNVLFENPGFGNHWVKLALTGTRSNRSAIGVRIRLDVTEGDRTRSIHAVVGSGGSFGGNPLRQEIGLGQATRIDRLEIYWPTSELRQQFEDLPVDRVIFIREDSNEIRSESPKSFTFRR